MVKVCKPDGEGTIAGTRGNGEDAPLSVIRGTSINPEVRPATRYPRRSYESGNVPDPNDSDADLAVSLATFGQTNLAAEN